MRSVATAKSKNRSSIKQGGGQEGAFEEGKGGAGKFLEYSMCSILKASIYDSHNKALKSF